MKMMLRFESSNLQQRRLIAKYATQFQKHEKKIDWDDNAFMTMFRRKLKNNVKNELMRIGVFIENFEKLIEHTIEIDDKFYEGIMEKRHDGNGFGNHKYGYKNSGFNNNESTRPPFDLYGPISIKFDSMRKNNNPKEVKNNTKSSKQY